MAPIGVASANHSIKVDVCVEHPIARAGLHAILHGQPNIEIVTGTPARNGNGAADVAVALGEAPFLVRGRPASDGPDKQVWVGSQVTETALLTAIRSGVRGFVSERGVAKELPEAVRVVASGGVFMSPDYAAGLVEWVAGQLPRDPARFRKAANLLSRRECEVLGLLGSGSSNAEIARRLVVSETTIRSHVYHILTKLDLPNRTQAVIYGYQFRLSLSAGVTG